MAKSLKNTGLKTLVELIKTKLGGYLPIDGSTTMTGNLNMGSHSIIGLVDLTSESAESTATNKKYVDAQDVSTLASAKAYTDAEAAKKLNLTGGTMSGDIDMDNNIVTGLKAPVDDTDATNKSYVDTADLTVLSQAQTYADNTFVELAGDTMTGDLNMGGTHKVTGLATPTADSDAANKKYVNDQDAATLQSAKDYTDEQVTDKFVQIDGSSVMTGSLKMGTATTQNKIEFVATPTANTDAANKAYVDDQDAATLASANEYTDTEAAKKLDLAGGTMTGEINMSTHKITSVAAPTVDGDAANKKYVDDADTELSTRIDAIEARTDVVDVVGTKAELLAYDVTTISENDIVKVLADESQEGAIAYYRLVDAEAETPADRWEYVGKSGPYYTKTETDEKISEGVAGKVDKAGDTMTGNLTMSNNATVTGLVNPTNDSDAANKAYADTKLALAGGTMTGAIAMGDNKITGLATPTADADAANKKYVDDQDAALEAEVDTKVAKAGDTMTGDLNMGGTHKVTGLATPTADSDAANKKYVDDQDAATLESANDYTDTEAAKKLDLTGGTMTGTITMSNGGIITGLTAAPTADSDASNKKYVDDQVAIELSAAEVTAIWNEVFA